MRPPPTFENWPGLAGVHGRDLDDAGCLMTLEDIDRRGVGGGLEYRGVGGELEYTGDALIDPFSNDPSSRGASGAALRECYYGYYGSAVQRRSEVLTIAILFVCTTTK